MSIRARLLRPDSQGGDGRSLDHRTGEGPNGRKSETTVSPEDARHQKPKQLGLPLDTRSYGTRMTAMCTCGHGVRESA
jgi:hypothetical protein